MRYQPSYQRLQIGLLCAVCVMIDLRVLCKCWGLGVPGLAAVRAAQSSPPPFPPPPRRGTARPGSGWSTLRPPAAPPLRWRWRPCPRWRCMRGQGRSARRTAAAPPTAQSRPLPGRHETRQLSDRSRQRRHNACACVRACRLRGQTTQMQVCKQTKADKSRQEQTRQGLLQPYDSSAASDAWCAPSSTPASRRKSVRSARIEGSDCASASVAWSQHNTIRGE